MSRPWVDNLGDLHEKNGGVALMMMLTSFHRCVQETKLLQRLAEQKKTKNEGSGEGRLGHARGSCPTLTLSFAAHAFQLSRAQQKEDGGGKEEDGANFSA